MTLREKILQELKELMAEQKAPAAIELIEDNYPEVVDYLSTEGMIAGAFARAGAPLRRRE